MDVIWACVGFSFKLFLISLQRVDIEFVEIKNEIYVTSKYIHIYIEVQTNIIIRESLILLEILKFDISRVTLILYFTLLPFAPYT